MNEPLTLNLFMTFVKLGKLDVKDLAALSASCVDNHTSSSFVQLLMVASTSNTGVRIIKGINSPNFVKGMKVITKPIT